MDKVEFKVEISKDKLLELTANKANELVKGYEELKEKRIKKLEQKVDHLISGWNTLWERTDKLRERLEDHINNHAEGGGPWPK